MPGFEFWRGTDSVAERLQNLLQGFKKVSRVEREHTD
jgi:hypothetical protein